MGRSRAPYVERPAAAKSSVMVIETFFGPITLKAERVRPEAEIRADLARQLEAVVRRWEASL
jgi:hypothetical protein